MDDEVRRQEQIHTYARELVRLYGFTGDEAEQERHSIASALVAGDPVDYDALDRRAGRHIRERELRQVLREDGLMDTEIDRLLSDFPGVP